MSLMALTSDLKKQATVPYSRQTLKFLQKMSKGSKGMVNIGLLHNAFEAMEGWSVENVEITVHLNGKFDTLWNLLRRWSQEGKSKKIVRSFMGSLSKKDAFEIRFEEGVSEREAQKYISSIKRHAKVVTTPPKSGKVGDVFVSRPYDLSFSSIFNAFETKIDNAWVVTPGWKFRASNGAEVTVPHPMSEGGRLEDPTGMKLSRFWTWGYKNGLKDSAAAALAAMDEEEVALKTAPKSKREWVRREHSEEVRKVLNQLVEKKYNKVVSALTKAATSALARFMDVHDDYVRSEREKGNKYPRFLIGSYFRTRPGEHFFYSAIAESIEHPDRISETWRRKSDWKKEISGWAKGMANQAKEQFISKNEVKLGRIVNTKGNLKTAKILSLHDGSYDYGGEIKFEFEDGSSFIVRNKTVWKVSQLGRPFLQFPTTFHNVIFPDGSKMTGSASEKRMIETFATK